jgi:hypothetical protein
MPKTTISRRIRLARVVIPIGSIEKTKKDAAKASSNACTAPPTDEPLIRFRIPVADLEKMLAQKRRAARRPPAASAESSPTVNFHLADYIKTPSPVVHFQLPLIRLELPLKTRSGNSGKK